MIMSKNIIVSMSLMAITTFSLFYTPNSTAETHKLFAHALEDEIRISKSMLTMHVNMRQLWEDHIIYTRNFIISSIANLEDTEKIAERLLKNQDDIGNAIKPIYGDDAGKKLTLLLKDHILIAAEIIKAAKMGDNDKVFVEQNKWRKNAVEIADFLSTANPNWPKSRLVDMLYKHLDLTTAEVTSRLKKDWSADLLAYEVGHEHMLMFSDVLTYGIIKQFPAKFAD